jgi:hypothetical protein
MFDGLVRQGDKFSRRASARRGIDKLGLVLNPARRMAGARLIRGEGLELAPIGLERSVAEGFDGRRHGRFVPGLRHHRRCRTHQREHDG